VTRNLATVANLDPLLNLHKRSDLHLIANLTPIKVRETVNANIPSQLHIGGNPLKRLFK
jgi:hypothetical protein